MMAVNPLNTPSTLYQPPIITICSKALLALPWLFVGIISFIRTTGKVMPTCNDLSSTGKKRV